MNPISEELKIGTLGELIVQLRLLQYDVQSAPALKDSGNDLIAVKGNSFRAIQVKTTTKNNFTKANLPEMYHILAIVHLIGEGKNIYLDQSDVFLVNKEEIENVGTNFTSLTNYKICDERVQSLFS